MDGLAGFRAGQRGKARLEGGGSKKTTARKSAVTFQRAERKRTKHQKNAPPEGVDTVRLHNKGHGPKKTWR